MGLCSEQWLLTHVEKCYWTEWGVYLSQGVSKVAKFDLILPPSFNHVKHTNMAVIRWLSRCSISSMSQSVSSMDQATWIFWLLFPFGLLILACLCASASSDLQDRNQNCFSLFPEETLQSLPREPLGVRVYWLCALKLNTVFWWCCPTHSVSSVKLHLIHIWVLERRGRAWAAEETNTTNSSVYYILKRQHLNTACLYYLNTHISFCPVLPC